MDRFTAMHRELALTSIAPEERSVCPRRQLATAIMLACAWALAFVVWLSPLALAADTAKDDTKASSEQAAPAPVPLSELSAQADAATTTLREIGTAAAADERFTDLERELPALAREIEARSRENARIVSRLPSLELLGTLERGWRSAREPLAKASGELEDRMARLDRNMSRLAALQKRWDDTLTLARNEQAPPEVIARIESLRSAISRTRATVEAQRDLALKLQSRVGTQTVKVDEATELIRQTRDITLNRIFSRDSEPLWNRDALAHAGARIATDTQDSREAQRTTLQTYAVRHADRFLLHFGLFLVLAAVLYWARVRLMAWVRTEPELEHASAVVAYPLATGLVLALMASRWIYPQAPRLLWALIGAAALIPAALVLRRLARPYLRPLLYAVVMLFFVDQWRLVTASVDLVPRIVFVAEMLGAAAFLLWFMRSIQRPRHAEGVRGYSRTVLLGVRFACVVFVVTAIANVLGYVAFANLVGNAMLRAMYFGLILYTVVAIVDALIAMALRARPLTVFGMVRRHRELLRRRTRMLLNALALVWWVFFLLDRLALRDRVISAAHAALTSELTIGAISISLADVLAFVIAVWASFLVSRFVQFVLDEEVFPHAKLKRGLPYAISRTVHYAILVAGFFFAMGVIGVDMTKFTILAGAFTVGVGFGLQTIFNNFVSGLILLFERPVQVGDIIQMDDAAGVVERIGIRASIVRTSNGSEVIVPNGKLISDRVVNWTFSDRQRGIEVPVSVVLGSQPSRVIEVLERVASGHPLVLKNPPPQALLTRLGPDWMGFELHAATDHVEDWMKARSELAIAVTEALKAENIALR
jgi:small-conductance mechanosensitive channel